MDGNISVEQAFINKLTGIVLDNLSNEQFSVKELAREAGISHASLHRKLKQIINLDGSQFIREIRLKRAMELLVRNAGTASEISFKVGFGSPAYFSKCFHDYYGFPPGEVKKRHSVTEIQDSETILKESSFPDLKPTGIIPEPSIRSKGNRNLIILFGSLIVLVTVSWYMYNTIAGDNGFFMKSKEYNRSIMVLPFKDLSQNQDNEFLSGCIIEDLLTSLFQISELRVISRTTSEHFRINELSAKELARETNARYLLEGSVRQYNDKARISVQLIDGASDQHIMSENFDYDLIDIIENQGNIATKIALRLKDAIPEIDIGNVGKHLTDNNEAYDNYMKGRFLLNRSTGEQRTDISGDDLKMSIQCFEQAIAADPNFADAYAGLASANIMLAGWGWTQPKSEGFLKAKILSYKALELNPDCAEAHSVKGAVYIWGENNFEEGRKELMTSLKLSPNQPALYQALAQLHMITGPIKEARRYMDLSLEFEPYYWVTQNLNAWIYYFEGKFVKGIEACKSAQVLKPDYIFTNWLLFLNYARSGDGLKASEELQKILSISTKSNIYSAEIEESYMKSGTEGLFEWLVDININRPVSAAGLNGHPFFIAWWSAITGNKEQSILWLRKNLLSKTKLYIYFNLIATNPDFDILRDDPRFSAIIHQLGLTTYNKRSAR